MNTALRNIIVVCGTFACLPLSAQETTYSFDTVKSISLIRYTSSIAGVQKDTGANLTVTFREQAAAGSQYAVNRCVPIFLTAIEKPGRYFLHVTIDPTFSSIELVGCRLELKP